MGNKWIVNLVRYYNLMSSRHNQSQRQISNQEETENDIRSSIPDLAMGFRFIQCQEEGGGGSERECTSGHLL